MPLARKPKRQYHHGDLQRALLDAALDLLKRGQPVGLRDVARKAGVSHTAPYRHFADKDDLLAAVAEEGFNRLTSVIRAARESAGLDPVEGYYACAAAYGRFATEHPAHYRVMFGPSSVVARAKDRPSLVAAGQAAFGTLLAVVGELQAARILRPGPPLETAMTLWSLEHGLAMLELDGRVDFVLPGEDPDTRTRRAHRALLEGLRRPK